MSLAEMIAILICLVIALLLWYFSNRKYYRTLMCLAMCELDLKECKERSDILRKNIKYYQEMNEKLKAEIAEMKNAN